jgi:hypothetical protein
MGRVLTIRTAALRFKRVTKYAHDAVKRIAAQQPTRIADFPTQNAKHGT